MKTLSDLKDPGAHGSDTPISPRAIYVLKSANGPNIFEGSVEIAHRVTYI